jgi:dTDP-4-dehydrorhamnose 3,5-epimerase
MIFRETRLPGAFLIDVERFEDERGFFAEGWKQDEAEKHGIHAVFNRSNISYNRKAGTLRGLHAQREPYAEAKLVRCPRGAIFDVIVDIRPDSPTYLQWDSAVLDAENRRMLYLAPGFLHGFQTLADDTEVFYQVAGTYRPDMEIGARFDDPAFNIRWPEAGERTLSPKDQQWGAFLNMQPA